LSRPRRSRPSFPTRRSSDLRPLPGKLASGCATAAAEAMFGVPGTDLRGIGEHAEGFRLTLQHEMAQTLPGAAFQGGRWLELQEVDRQSTRLNSSHVRISYAA